MSKVICEREDLVAVADAIRSKTGNSAEMSLAQMPENISDITGSGGIIPSGTKTITSNGTYDVTEYASANVSVAGNEQATPTITVNSSGLITATAGDKSSTKQLNTQAAKTVTPTTQAQTAVSSGVYTTGAVTVAAIPSSYIQPSGTLNITSNGTYDVKNYASALVGVESSGGGGSSSGGLPVGISAITTGTFTPTQDYSSAISIEHDLGVAPNFFFWMVETDLSSAKVNGLNIGGATLRKTHYHSSSAKYTTSYFYRGYNASGTLGGSQSAAAANYLTETTCRIFCNSTYKLLTGHTYRWVAGVIE